MLFTKKSFFVLSILFMIVMWFCWSAMCSNPVITSVSRYLVSFSSVIFFLSCCLRSSNIRSLEKACFLQLGHAKSWAFVSRIPFWCVKKSAFLFFPSFFRSFSVFFCGKCYFLCQCFSDFFSLDNSNAHGIVLF